MMMEHIKQNGSNTIYIFKFSIRAMKQIHLIESGYVQAINHSRLKYILKPNRKHF